MADRALTAGQSGSLRKGSASTARRAGDDAPPGRIIDLPVDPRARRARLTAALTREARLHDEWRRCLTNAEAATWARRLAKIAIERYGLEADEAAKIADAVAREARRYSHTSPAQAHRARVREANRREDQRPRDERWMQLHDEEGLSWREIGEREAVPVSPFTVRNAVRRLRKRLSLSPPPTVRGTAYRTPPEDIHCSTRSAPATISKLECLQQIKAGNAGVATLVDDPQLIERMRDGVLDCNRMIDEAQESKRAIFDMLQELERGYPSPRQVTFNFEDDEQGRFPF